MAYPKEPFIKPALRMKPITVRVKEAEYCGYDEYDLLHLYFID